MADKVLIIKVLDRIQDQEFFTNFVARKPPLLIHETVRKMKIRVFIFSKIPINENINYYIFKKVNFCNGIIKN
jgi:hypothetical protein